MPDDPSMTTPPTPPTPAVPVVDYNTPRADQVSRGKFVIILVLAAVFGGVLLLGLTMRVARSTAVAQRVVVAPPPTPAVRVNVQVEIAKARRESNEARLKQLMTATLAPTQVVYEEAPIAARKLFGKGVCNTQASRREMSQPFFSAFEPPVYRTDGFWHESSDQEQPALLFAGPRMSPNGNQRLVMLDMEVKLSGVPQANDEYTVVINRKLTYRICQPKMIGSWPDTIRNGVSLKVVQSGGRDMIPIKWIDGTVRSARPSEYNVHFFAGQPDPKDPAHFTVEYEISGVKNVIDAWLTDDDFLRVIPRAGKVERGNWQIEAVK
jgi:hypothetical protein